MAEGALHQTMAQAINILEWIKMKPA